LKVGLSNVVALAGMLPILVKSLSLPLKSSPGLRALVNFNQNPLLPNVSP